MDSSSPNDSKKITQTPKKSRSIKNFLIDPTPQLQLTARLVFIGAVGLACILIVMASGFVTQSTLMSDAIDVSNPNMEVLENVNRIFVEHLATAGIVSIIFIVVMMTAIIVYTHRIYGAIFNIRKFVGDLSAGAYDSRCKLRKGDDLQELANDLNLLAAKLEAQHGASAKSK